MADGVWPQFLHPYPLSGKYFLVSAKLTPHSLWGIYLVDVFDNLLLLKESPGFALLEPIPLQPTVTPPRITDRVDLQRTDAVVYLADVYRGGGLKGVPRGTVKQLRVFTYHFSYRGMGGLLGAIGMDGPWDIKRVLGTVPVEDDGSAAFRVPANTPITVQPLDAKGQALQLMRSWFTAMPGETLSCIGCHETQNSGPPNHPTLAARRAPSEITPWRGPLRGFAFHREVQPVLDRHCVSCHNGQPRADGTRIADLRGTQQITDWSSAIAGHVSPTVGGKFSLPYAELHRFVRRPGIESDIHLLAPLEFHADATELVQLLRKGHYGVQLDAEAWDRLVTWIDLNAPYHGTWSEIVGAATVQPLATRKRELLKRYAGVDDDPEAIPVAATSAAASSARVSDPAAASSSSARVSDPAVTPDRRSPADQETSGQPGGSVGRPATAPVGRPATAPRPAAPQPVACPDWPFAAAEAQRRQGAADQARRTIDLDGQVQLELVRIPAGEFVMGNPTGPADEQPACRVTIDKPFWMGRYEVTNEQFARFDPQHDSHYETMHGYQFGMHGYPVNRPRQPAVRLSWNQAFGFCQWLSQKTGRRFALPTEAQWEYACRAGTATPFSFGEGQADFSKDANLGDLKLRELALDTYISVHVLPQPNKYDDWVPKDERFNDGGLVSVEVGSYRANAWGLQDMHGNVGSGRGPRSGLIRTRRTAATIPPRPAGAWSAAARGTIGRHAVRLPSASPTNPTRRSSTSVSA